MTGKTADEKLQGMADRARAEPPGSMSGLADSALQGVTVSFLSQVFRMDHNLVKRKLVNCPILTSRRRGTTQVQHLYDLATAAQYLVEVEIDVADVIANMRKEDLPPSINGAYWDAQLKRQKFEEIAGDLWRSEKVWEVFASTFQSMKFAIDLWADTVDRQTGLTEKQRELIYEMSDALKSDIYAALMAQAEEKSTGSQLEELPPEMKGMTLDEAAAALI